MPKYEVDYVIIVPDPGTMTVEATNPEDAEMRAREWIKESLFPEWDDGASYSIEGITEVI